MYEKLILGGGASGLSCAVLLPHSRIIEANSHIGGLSTSVYSEGFTFDQGPHIMFSKNKEVLKIMVDSLQGNVHTSKRNNMVMIGKKLLRYPIENDLVSLPLNIRFAALRDYLKTKLDPRIEKPKDLEDWFLVNFGETLTNLYFKPYNEKVWNLPFDQLSMTWADRIPSPPWEDVISGALGLQSEGYLHQLHYQYPKRGGYQSLMQSWANLISRDRITLNSTIERIEKIEDKKYKIVVNGIEELFIGDIISTIPLKSLSKIFNGTPQTIVDAISRLPVNPLITVNLGFLKQDFEKYTAIYFPEPEFLVNRISYPGVFSPNNVPSKDHTLIQAEITVAEGSAVLKMSDEELIDHVLAGLRERELLEEKDTPVFKYVQRIQNAYVVYPNQYEIMRQEISEYFLNQGIYINGRLGSHYYANVDGILEQSIELARTFDPSLTINEIRSLFSLSSE